MENKKLYYRNCNFNQVAITKELVNIIKNKGGVIVSSYKTTQEKITYYNLTKREEKQDIKNKLEKMQERAKTKELNEIQKKYMNELENKLLRNKKAIEKIESFYDKYITFYYDNYIYYIQLNDNPFFDNLFLKTKVDEKTENSYITYYSYYAIDLESKLYYEIMKNDIFNYLTKKEIKESAELLFNFLINHKPSELVKNKIKVNNMYDNRYHFEYTTEKRKKEYKKEVLENEL